MLNKCLVKRKIMRIFDNNCLDEPISFAVVLVEKSFYFLLPLLDFSKLLSIGQVYNDTFFPYEVETKKNPIHTKET